jgi:DNA repair exonuclease SbcCD ATPase subunit
VFQDLDQPSRVVLVGQAYRFVEHLSESNRLSNTETQPGISATWTAQSIKERRGTHDDPATETERWLEEISEACRKRARNLEMAAERLIDFEEVRAQLTALEDTRKTAERGLRALQHRTERLAQPERDRDSLLESYAGVLPAAIDALESEERHWVYR